MTSIVDRGRLPIRPLATIALGALAIACGSPSLVARSTTFESDATEIIDRGGVPIEWLGTEQAYPVLRVQLGGRSLRLLVDTGANAHFLERGTVVRLGLAPESDAPIYGASGDVVTGQVLETPALELGLAGTRPDGVWLAVDARPLIQAGLAGVLSPQLVAPEGGAIEIDFPGSRLRVVSAARAAELLMPAPGWTALRPRGVGSAGAATFTAPLVLEGTTIEVLVDSGSDLSDLSTSTEIGLSLMSRAVEQVRAVGIDGSHVLPRVTGVGLELAGWRGTGTLRLTVEPAHPLESIEGAVGMELLRHCVLVLAREAGVIRCE